MLVSCSWIFRVFIQPHCRKTLASGQRDVLLGFPALWGSPERVNHQTTANEHPDRLGYLNDALMLRAVSPNLPRNLCSPCVVSKIVVATFGLRIGPTEFHPDQYERSAIEPGSDEKEESNDAQISSKLSHSD